MKFVWACLISLGCLSLFAASVEACSITVSNDSQLQTANNTAGAGDVVCIKAGRYSEQLKPNNSGTATNRLVYQGEAGVVFETSGTAVVLNTSYVTVEGIRIEVTAVLGKRAQVMITGSHNLFEDNHIEVVAPTYDKGDRRVAVMYRYGDEIKPAGISLGGDQNDVRGNTVIGTNFGVQVDKGGGMQSKIVGNTILDVAQSAIVVGSSEGEMRGLLIEGNYMDGSWIEDGIQFSPTYGGDVSAIENFGTVVRGNVFRNMSENAIDFKAVRHVVIEQNIFHRTIGSNNGGMEGYSTSDNRDACDDASRGTGKTVDAQLPVYDESNRTQRAGVYPCWTTWGDGASTFGRGAGNNSDHAIVRYNIFYGNAGGIAPKDNNYKMYNNTVLGNNLDFSGYQAAPRDGYLFNNKRDTVFMNNIVGGHRGADVRIEGLSTSDESKLRIGHNLYWGSEPVSLERNPQTGDPGLTGISSNQPDEELEYDDFALTGDSTNAIDTGGWIAEITANGTNTQTIPVNDPWVFFDGYGIVNGDDVMIQTGGGILEAQIVSVDYDAKTLELNRSVSVSSGDRITLAFEGEAPDIGALEYGGALPAYPKMTTAPTPQPTVEPAGNGWEGVLVWLRNLSGDLKSRLVR